ncbi:MAG: hypothetical protein JHD16_01210 [Solirubrobacteraceae bacterium]|nr:hypothetical protein [Solirubrobacteraceae bacterium]
MTCPACGALGGAADERCRACGQRLGEAAPAADSGTPGNSVVTASDTGDFEVVLRPRRAPSPASTNGSGPTAAAPMDPPTAAAQPTGGHSPLPGVGPPRKSLVVELDDLGSDAEAPTVARPAAPLPAPPAVLPEPAWAPPAGPAPAPPAPWQPVTGTMPAFVPPSGPPAPPQLPRGGESGGGGPLWRRPHVLGPAAALLLIVLGIGGWMLFGRGSADERTAGSVLQAAQTRVTDLAGRAGRATKLVTLRTVGREAATAASDLEGREQTAATIENTQLRDQTVALLRAQRAYLAGLGGLQRLEQSDLLKAQLPGWSETKTTLQQATRSMNDAQAPIAARELPGQTSIDLSGVGRSTETVDKTVRSASWALRQWRGKLKAYNVRVAAAQRRSARIAEYRQQVRGVLASYEQDRTKVDEFVEDVDDYDFSEGEDYQAAKERVLGFQNDRQSTIADLQQYASQAPTAAQTEHAALVEPVLRSLDGLSNMLDAVDEAWFAEEPARSMPSWAEYEALNGDIDAKLEGSKQTWEARVEGLRVEARTAGVGTRPKRPDV